LVVGGVGIGLGIQQHTNRFLITPVPSQFVRNEDDNKREKHDRPFDGHVQRRAHGW
jgi:hypothetical protein